MSEHASSTIAFTAGADRSGPFTWGQTAIWDVLRWLPPGDTSLNQSEVLPVPAGRTADQVAAALRELIERHDSLRSLYREESGTLTQHVRGAGEVEFELRPPGTDPDAVRESLAGRHFDAGNDLPIRAALAGPAVVIAVNHMAVDGGSFRIVVADLATLLAQGPGSLPPRGQQPLERAGYESSPDGQRRAQRTLQHWERHSRAVSAPMVEQIGPEQEADRGWATIDSTALAAAANQVASAAGVQPSLVVLAFIGLTLSIRCRTPDAALRMLAATRFRPENVTLVGAFNQNALLRFGTEDQPLGQFLQRVAGAQLAGLRSCEADPRQVDEAVRKIAAERGISTGAYCFVNDVRPGAVTNRATPVPVHDAPAPATEPTTIETRSSLDRQYQAKFFLFFRELSERCVLSLCADHRFLGPGGPAGFLADLERLVVRAAADPAPGVGDLRAYLDARDT